MPFSAFVCYLQRISPVFVKDYIFCAVPFPSSSILHHYSIHTTRLCPLAAILSNIDVEFPDEIAETIFTPREAAGLVMRAQPGPTPIKNIEDTHDDHDHH